MDFSIYLIVGSPACVGTCSLKKINGAIPQESALRTHGIECQSARMGTFRNTREEHKNCYPTKYTRPVLRDMLGRNFGNLSEKYIPWAKCSGMRPVGPPQRCTGVPVLRFVGFSQTYQLDLSRETNSAPSQRNPIGHQH